MARTLLLLLSEMQRKRTRSEIRRRRWSVRSQSGAVVEIRSLAHIALLILDGRIEPDAEVSAGDGHWTPLSRVVDTGGLAATLDALGHLSDADREGDDVEADDVAAS